MAGLWTGGGALLLREVDARHAGVIDVNLERVVATVSEERRGLLREAMLLARDPAVVEGARKGDWATLARGAARLRALTLERLADLVVVLDAGGVALLQVPATPRVELPAPALPGNAAVTHGVDLVLVKPLQIQEILDALAEVARSAASSARPEDNRWPFST